MPGQLHALQRSKLTVADSQPLSGCDFKLCLTAKCMTAGTYLRFAHRCPTPEAVMQVPVLSSLCSYIQQSSSALALLQNQSPPSAETLQRCFSANANIELGCCS